MSTTIKIENDYSWLLTENNSIKSKLWKALRFRDKNYFFNAAYKMQLWDGFHDFFDKNTGKFLTGLLPEVTSALKHWGIDYQTIDNQSVAPFITESVDENWLSGLTLRDYQVDYINQSITHKRGLVCSQTGSGKTAILIGILKAINPNIPILVLCNKTDLVEQNYEEINKFGFSSVGRVHGTKKEVDKTIICATWQSIKNIKHRLGDFRCLIVDEIHEMMSPKVKMIYRLLKKCSVRIGLSATAFKFDGKDSVQKYLTKGFFGPPFYVKSIEGGKPTTSKLQEMNILSTAEFIVYDINEPFLPYEVYQDAVTRGIAENVYFHDVVSQLSLMLTGRTIIMVERIKQGDMLKEMLPDAAWVSGNDNRKTRKYVIDRLRHDTDNVIAIATTGIFNTGINVFVHNLINAAGGKAEHAIIQRLGRGLRPAGDKEKLRYFDFYFTINPYLETHSIKRLKTLAKEGHKVVRKGKFDFSAKNLD